MQGKLLYAQSGGVTAVINATARAAIARAGELGLPLLAARNGILGLLREELVDTARLDPRALEALDHSPGSAFGTCRYRLPAPAADSPPYARLFAVCRAHDIRAILYNGGNDSADTALKLARASRIAGFPLRVIAVPKTIDNDLVLTDTCPGFGSAAKYIALATLEAGLDVAAMHATSTRVFVLEVMGRNAGWLAAASALAARRRDDPPHLILFPEVAFDAPAFLARVRAIVARIGYCVVVASEGVRDATGRILAEAGGQDAFGHPQLGGVGATLAALVARELALKCHWALPDYLQRSARHAASGTDLALARAVGRSAVDWAAAGRDGVLAAIVRLADTPYRWKIAPVPLVRVANRERRLPRAFIGAGGYGITPAARRYLAPLIQGEAPPPLAEDGLPLYAAPIAANLRRRLPPWDETAGK